MLACVLLLLDCCLQLVVSCHLMLSRVALCGVMLRRSLAAAEYCHALLFCYRLPAGCVMPSHVVSCCLVLPRAVLLLSECCHSVAAFDDTWVHAMKCEWSVGEMWMSHGVAVLYFC